MDSSEYLGGMVFYNGIPTIQAKTQLALQRASGIMIWELSQDTMDETSLLNAIFQTVQGSK
jgi:GH18 family chitinase